MGKSKLCVGIIGAGAISGIYLQNMTTKFDELYAKSICDTNPESAQKKASEYGIKAVAMDELLNDPEIDIVVNLTPAFAHYEVIKSALEHGKHVYTEKTLTDQLERSEELVNLAREKGLYLGSAPDTFLGAALQTARAVIDAGLLGEINSFAISGNRCNDILLPLFGILRRPGCGLVLDYAVYYVTALVTLLGPVARVGSVVRAPYRTHVNRMPQSPLFGQVMDTPNESQVSAVLQMESGVTGTLHIDADSVSEDQAHFILYGTKGMLYLTDPNKFGGEIRFLPRTLDTDSSPVTLWSLAKYGENSRGAGPANMAGTILRGEELRPSAELACHVHEVLNVMLESGESGAFRDIISTCVRPAPLPQRKVPITKLAHAGYNVCEMAAMLRFYEDILGMEHLFTLTAGDRLGTDDSRKWIEYLKLADYEYMELFHQVDGLDPERSLVKDRWDNYGFLKLNFEVSDLNDLRDRLITGGVPLDEDIHRAVDGSLEIKVHDPDGNEVQFTQYPTAGSGLLELADAPGHRSCSAVEHITQAAFQVRDEANMLLFYTRGLNLKHAGRLTFGDLAIALEGTGAPAAEVNRFKMFAEKPWLDYIEVAPHQYIELFYTTEEPKQELRDLNDKYGYQHICFEVSDIQAAWDAVCENGLTPDCPITLGCEGTYQFWLTDPDGNRMEFQQYTRDSKQLL